MPHTDLGISFSAIFGCPFGFTFWSSSSTLCSITPTWRRRLRRARARARLAWYLHRRGFVRLSKQKLKEVLLTLKNHHSKDPGLLARLRTEMEKLDPWRCRYCMMLVKGKSAQCGGCWRHWEQCYDSSYVHQPKTSAYTGGWNDHGWTAAGPWTTNRPKSPRRRTQSPRQRTKAQQSHADEGKGKHKGGGSKGYHGPPSTQWLSPPTLPASMLPADPPAVPPMSSAPSVMTMPSMQPFPKSGGQKDEQELHTLRHLFKEIKNKPNLPDDIKKVVQATEVSVRKVDAKSHSQLVSQLNNIRKKLTEIDEQWAAYRDQWAAYLDKATQMWMAHVEEFEQGELRLAERRNEALHSLHSTRDALQDAHRRTMDQDVLESNDIATAQEALDASMNIEEEDGLGVQSSFAQIKENLTGVVQQVKNTIEGKIKKRERALGGSAEAPDVEIVEPADRKSRDSDQP